MTAWGERRSAASEQGVSRVRVLLLVALLTAEAGERAIIRVPPRLAMAVSWLLLTDGSTGVSEALHLMAK